MWGEYEYLWNKELILPRNKLCTYSLNNYIRKHQGRGDHHVAPPSNSPLNI